MNEEIFAAAAAIRDEGVPRSGWIHAAAAVREEYGLTIPQTIEIIAWLEGGGNDHELRQKLKPGGTPG